MKGTGWVVVLAALAVTPAMAVGPVQPSPEAALLQKWGISTTTKGLIKFLKDRTPDDRDIGNVEALVRLLRDDDFATREEASRRFVRLGHRALGALKALQGDRDPEVKKRARACLIEITGRTPSDAIRLAVRVLREREARQSAPAVLGILAASEADEAVEMWHALVEFARTEVPPAVREARNDKQWQRRAVCGLILGRYGNRTEKTVALQLLRDAKPEVRLRAAQGLLGAGNCSGLAALTTLLEEAALPLAWEAEELLRYAAGITAPTEVIGPGTPAARKATRTAWVKWLKGAPRVQLVGPERIHHRPSLVLVFDPKQQKGRTSVKLRGGDGQSRGEVFLTLDKALAVFPQARDHYFVADPSGDRELVKRGIVKGEPLSPRRPTTEADMERIRQRMEMGKLGRLASGNQLIAGRVPVIWERDTAGRVVWLSCDQDRRAGLVICPLVRVGFPATGTVGLDINSADWLCKYLKHPEVQFRRYAAGQLAELRPTVASVKALGHAFDDRDSLVRLGAVRALQSGGVGAETNLPGLKKFVAEGGEIGREAVTAIGACGREGAIELVRLFRSLSREAKSHGLKIVVVRELGRLTGKQDKIVQPALETAARDTDPAVRIATVTGICCFGVDQRQYGALIGRLLRDPSDDVAREAMRLLSYAKAKPSGLVRALKPALARPKLRQAAIAAIGAVGKGDPEAMLALKPIIKTAKDAETRGTLATALGSLGSAETVLTILPVLESYLDDSRRCWKTSDVTVQEMAADAIGKIGNPASEASKQLKRKLMTTPPDSRLAQAIRRALVSITRKAGSAGEEK